MAWESTQEGKFAVGLLFWDDIYSGLALDPTVLSSHYPGLMISAGTTSGSASSDRLSGLVLGYYGGFFWHFIELLFSEVGEMAGEDPEQLRTLVRMLKTNSRVLTTDDAADITKWCAEVEELVFNVSTSPNVKGRWRQTKELAKGVEQRVRHLPNLVADRGAADAIELGLALGRINHADGEFTFERSKALHRMFAAMLPHSEGPLIELLGRLEGKDNYKAGPALYAFADWEIRFPSRGGST
jgi:hypothetical protein